jgi:hypothetical protein
MWGRLGLPVGPFQLEEGVELPSSPRSALKMERPYLVINFRGTWAKRKLKFLEKLCGKSA